jgi:hypothetical protein
MYLPKPIKNAFQGNLNRCNHSTIIKITGKSYRLKGKLDINDRASKNLENSNTS